MAHRPPPTGVAFPTGGATSIGGVRDTPRLGITMPRRPCLGTDIYPCHRLSLPNQPRCGPCTRAHQQARGTRQARGYDRDYDTARKALHLEDHPPCHWGCGRVATTADHDPPMSEYGRHTRLVPACAPCNYGHRSARETLQRLSTDVGW